MELTSQAGEKALRYLTKLGEHYQQAYAVAVRLGPGLVDQRDRDQLLKELQEFLVTISAFEIEHVDERNALLSSGASKSAEINRQLGYVRAFIEKVLQAINAAESEAFAARARLTPQLDQRTKARQVRAAYQAANGYRSGNSESSRSSEDPSSSEG